MWGSSSDAAVFRFLCQSAARPQRDIENTYWDMLTEVHPIGELVGLPQPNPLRIPLAQR